MPLPDVIMVTRIKFSILHIDPTHQANIQQLFLTPSCRGEEAQGGESR